MGHVKFIFIFVGMLSLMLIVRAQGENIPNKIFEKMGDISDKQLFKIFHTVYNKSYDLNSEEGVKRYKNFKRSLKKIKDHKLNGNKEYKLGITELADYYNEELTCNGKLLMDDSTPAENLYSDNSKNVSGYYSPINWVDKGAFGPKMYSAYCLYDNHLSGAAVVEAVYNLKFGTRINISPQSLIDCVRNPRNHPTYGIPSSVGESILNGFYSDDVYPVTGNRGICNIANITTPSLSPPKWQWMNFPFNTYYNGPVTTDTIIEYLKKGVIVYGSLFVPDSLYTGGLYTPTRLTYKCASGGMYDLILVGYGIDASSSKDYWIVRGYFGKNWGENGFMRLVRDDSQNNFGINCAFSRPVY
jgi:hypothetical protein